MSNISQIETSQIVAGDNDRTVFRPDDIKALAENIKANGLIQPITVRQIEDSDLYEIVAGERRYRAIDSLGWDEIPAIVADLTDEEASAVMLAENVSRSDIDPIDEALAYQKRISVYGWTVAECAEKAGKSCVHVQFRIKLLKLRNDVQALVRSGDMQLGYAQILADAGLDAYRQAIAIRVLRDNASPTPPWFRRIVSELLGEQAQESMLPDDFGPLFTGSPEMAPATDTATPPTPTDTTPPTIGETIKEVIDNQIKFWKDAAEEWQLLGKPFKRQECMAAATALANVYRFA